MGKLKENMLQQKEAQSITQTTKAIGFRPNIQIDYFIENHAAYFEPWQLDVVAELVNMRPEHPNTCLLYTSDAADE